MQYFHFDSLETACTENNDLAAGKTIHFFLFSPLFSLQVLWEKNLKILSAPLFSKILSAPLFSKIAVDIPGINSTDQLRIFQCCMNVSFAGTNNTYPILLLCCLLITFVEMLVHS